MTQVTMHSAELDWGGGREGGGKPTDKGEKGMVGKIRDTSSPHPNICFIGKITTIQCTLE